MFELSSKNKTWIAQTLPINKNKYPPKPISVNKKSDIFAPRGPP